MKDIPLDSREGARILIGWAKAGGFVLNEYHERIAHKWGVDTQGVIFARPLRPLT